MRYDRRSHREGKGCSLIFLYFLIICLAAAGLWAALAASVSVWSLLGVFALSFLAANLLFALLFTVNSWLLPRLKPGEGIEKPRRLSRWICAATA